MRFIKLAVVTGSVLVSSPLPAGPYHYSTFDVPGAASTQLNGINNKGHIVGVYTDANGEHGFYFDGITIRPFEVPGASRTTPLDINDSGHVVGYTGGVFDAQQGFVFDGSIFTELTFPGARATWAQGINNAGRIVGLYFSDLEGGNRGFVFDGESFSSIEYPSALGTDATAINDAGLIVGAYQQDALTRNGFSMADQIISPLMFASLVPGDLTSQGVIVGTHYPGPFGLAESTGFVLPGSVLAFDTVKYSNAHSTQIDGVNDAGVLVGQYVETLDGRRVVHGLIATPVPEPSCGTLAVIVGVALLSTLVFRLIRGRPCLSTFAETAASPEAESGCR